MKAALAREWEAEDGGIAPQRDYKTTDYGLRFNALPLAAIEKLAQEDARPEMEFQIFLGIVGRFQLPN